MPPWIVLEKEAVTVTVRVSPNARRSGIEGVWNGSHLKIALQAPPIDGRANEALIDFLSKTTGMRKSAITLCSGSTARQKRIRIACSAPQAIAELLIQSAG